MRRARSAPRLRPYRSTRTRRWRFLGSGRAPRPSGIDRMPRRARGYFLSLWCVIVAILESSSQVLKDPAQGAQGARTALVDVHVGAGGWAAQRCGLLSPASSFPSGDTTGTSCRPRSRHCARATGRRRTALPTGRRRSHRRRGSRLHLVSHGVAFVRIALGAHPADPAGYPAMCAPSAKDHPGSAERRYARILLVAACRHAICAAPACNPALPQPPSTRRGLRSPCGA